MDFLLLHWKVERPGCGLVNGKSIFLNPLNPSPATSSAAPCTETVGEKLSSSVDRCKSLGITLSVSPCGKQPKGMRLLKFWGVYFGLLFPLWTLAHFNNWLWALKAVLELVCPAISDHRFKMPLSLCGGKRFISVFSSVYSVSPITSWTFGLQILQIPMCFGVKERRTLDICYNVFAVIFHTDWGTVHWHNLALLSLNFQTRGYSRRKWGGRDKWGFLKNKNKINGMQRGWKDKCLISQHSWNSWGCTRWIEN